MSAVFQPRTNPLDRVALREILAKAKASDLTPVEAQATLVLIKASAGAKYDDEVPGKIESSWGEIGPQDADMLRSIANGEDYISPTEARLEEKAKRKRVKVTELSDALEILRRFGATPGDDAPAAQVERDGAGDRQRAPHITRTPAVDDLEDALED